MEEKYFMIVWGCVHTARSDENPLEKLKNFRSKIKKLFNNQIISDHETRIDNACIIKTSSPTDEIRLKVANLLVAEPDFGSFGTGCYFEVHVLQMDSLLPVLPIPIATKKNATL